MLYRTLGSTGEKVSAIGIGGSHIGLNGVDEQLSIRILRTSVDRGITFMDNRRDGNMAYMAKDHARLIGRVGFSEEQNLCSFTEEI